ncbi:ZC2HC1C family protein [Megaselia abdita]
MLSDYYKSMSSLPRLGYIARYSSDGQLNSKSSNARMTDTPWPNNGLAYALSHIYPSNLGSSLDMRFQQKQKLEKEQRKMEMTATKLPHQEILNTTITVATNRLRTKTTGQTTAGTPSTISSTKTLTTNTEAALDSSIGAGKVRQMFNERRRGVGIDKSNPLKPINTVITPTKGRTKSEEPRKKVITSSDLIRQAIRNGGSDLNLNENTLYEYPSNINNPTSLDNETFPDDLDGFGLTTVKMSPTLLNKSPDSNNNPSRGTTIKLKPVITKKAPPKRNPITPMTKPMVKTAPLSNKKTKVAFHNPSYFNKI